MYQLYLATLKLIEGPLHQIHPQRPWSKKTLANFLGKQRFGSSEPGHHGKINQLRRLEMGCHGNDGLHLCLGVFDINFSKLGAR